MFGQKTGFGASGSTGFGGFGTNTSTFGSTNQTQTFGATAGSAFGQPQQPQTGGLFGSTATSTAGGGLFGTPQTSTSTGAFGSTGFGGNTSFGSGKRNCLVLDEHPSLGNKDFNDFLRTLLFRNEIYFILNAKE